MRIEYKEETIEFSFEYRKRKSFEIKIHPSGEIALKVPKGIPEKQIIEIVKSKADWILKKLKDIQERSPIRSERNYVNGEMFLVFGEEYPLSINIDFKRKQALVFLDKGTLHVETNSADKEVVRTILIYWYKELAKKRVMESINHYQQYFSTVPKAIRIKNQKTRWGSCSSKQNLNFNLRCAMAPKEVLDYVVVHEMCHLVHMNHSKAFWDLVESIMPDYKARRGWLKQHGSRLMSDIS